MKFGMFDWKVVSMSMVRGEEGKPIQTGLVRFTQTGLGRFFPIWY